MSGEFMPETPDDGSAAKRALKLDYSTVSPTLRIVLPPPDEEEKRSIKRAQGRGPLLIGFHRDMPDAFKRDLSPQLNWTELSDGSFVTSVSVTSPEAESVRVSIRAGLSPGGEIRFFRPGSEVSLRVVTREDFHFVEGAMEPLWSPTADGETIGIEVYLPSAKAVGVFSLSVDTIAHTLVSTTSLPQTRKLACPDLHIDVACRESNIDHANETAVARIRLEVGGLSGYCSGTVLNDKDPDTAIPYFLTANHCVSTAAVARTIEFAWFYQKARCNGNSLDSRYRSISSGADLLTTSSQYDQTLLRIRGSIPGGVWFSGWNARVFLHPKSVYGIHHPDATVKSYSSGTSVRNGDVITRTEDGTIVEILKNLTRVEWIEGTIEPGSSGSGLFLRDGGGLVVGAASLGQEVCGPGDPAMYGSFSDFFPQVSRWLTPGEPPPPKDDHGDTPETASVVKAPSSVQGILERNGDRDYFKFTIGAPGVLRVYTTGTTDTHGTLTRVDDGSSVENGDGGEGYNFSIRFVFATPGDYFVQVGGYLSLTTGAYTLHVNHSTDNLGEADYVLPLMTEAGNTQRQGFIRLINKSDRKGTVIIHAIDDSGQRFGPGSLSVEANESLNFNSRDLEQGNTTLGLYGVGTEGSGDWRVELHTSLDIEARAYIRTRDGFLTSMQDVAEESSSGSMRYRIPFFNPASNTSLVSWLRLINPGTSSATIEISGVDADGAVAPGGSVGLTLAAGAARLLNAQQLENGASGLSGRLGDGKGKWQLWVSSDQPIQVMGLMRTRSGHLSNLSR